MTEKSNKLLILDLDETLIHATETQLEIAEYFRYSYWCGVVYDLLLHTSY